MGKGNGNNPPRKFIGDQYFCEVFIFAFMGASITLSSFSVGMDDGGKFPYQYAFTGFVLGPILLVNLISRMYVVNAVEKKGLTRKNIIHVLTKTRMGSIVWPWSCRAGMMWCIPGLILTGMGGVNCGIEEQHNGTQTTEKVRNDCYYDIEGEHGEMYKGLAIGLLVVHIGSFIYLLLSNCPVHTVLDQIKEDPNTPARRSNTQSSANTTTTTAAATTTTTTATTTAASTSNETNNNRELVTKIERLEARLREIENRDSSQAQAFAVSTIAAPPPYSQLMDLSDGKPPSTHHV